MSEQALSITCGELRLEGLYHRASGERAVVVTHPHSLYGGDMHNPVVETVVEAYRARGYATLRFNFRGVGGSTGRYGDGVGEVQDVAAALECLSALGHEVIDLAGYSFGAWVNLRYCDEHDHEQPLLLVSPPVAMLDFGPDRPRHNVLATFVGSDDQIAASMEVRRRVQFWNPQATVDVLAGADHFYSGCCPALRAAIDEFLQAR